MSLSAIAILTLAELRRHLKIGSAAIASSPSPAVGGATLTPSANGFLPGMPVTIVTAGVDRSVTLTDVASNAVTWTPNLPSVPVAGDAVFDSAGDVVLEDLINAISAEFERETGRVVIARAKTETKHGDGRPVLGLRWTPIVSVASLTIDGVALDPSDYVLDTETGLVRLRARTFTAGVGNVVASYTGGYAAADVPADLKRFIRDWCKFAYDEWHTDSVAATSVSIGNQTFQINPELPRELRRGIGRFRDQRPLW